MQVTFVDYGNSQTVPLSFLTKLSRFECQLPAQAIECYLTSVRPSAISAAEETWAEEANARLEQLVTDRRLMARVRRGVGEAVRSCRDALITGRERCLAVVNPSVHVKARQNGGTQGRQKVEPP